MYEPGRSKPKFRKPGESETLYPDRINAETVLSESNERTLPLEAEAVTSFIYNRYNNLPIESQQQKLPIFQYRQHILYLLEKHQTLVLLADTGSGKSTQVPQYLCDVGHTVCVTQPRVTAAISLSRRVAQERERLSRDSSCDVAHAVSFESNRTKDTKIIYMTEGILLREMLADPLLTQYSCIMLDEVHERSLNTDLLIGLTKKILRKRKNLKLIVASATMEAEKIRAFFDMTKVGNQDGVETAVILHARGKVHPVEVFYLSEPAPDYVKETIATVIKIHENEVFGDILAFLTSQEEIDEAVSELRDYASENNRRNETRSHFPSKVRASNMLVLPMYGTLPHYKQLEVFRTAGANERKVVIATNIAETSITIPGITYVIDCGFHKLLYNDVKLNLCKLVVCEITKSNALQRSGRAGRTNKGKCYRLYTEEAFTSMYESIPPEIERTDLSSAILQLKALGIQNVLKFPFITRPPVSSVLSALEHLFALKAISADGQLTDELGVLMSALPLTPTMAKLVCCSGEFGVQDEIISIVSLLQVENVFTKPHKGKEIVAAKISKRNNFAVSEGDIITYLNVFESCKKVLESESDERKSKKKCSEWCRQHFVHYQAMQKVFEIRNGLERLIKKKFKIENKIFEGPDLGSGRLSRVLRCFCSALFANCCYLHPDGTYHTLKGDESVTIAESSVLYDAPQPRWLLYANVQCARGKIYIRDLAAIQKEWILEHASHYYKEV